MIYTDFRQKKQPGNKPIPVRKTAQNCPKTVPEASPEKPEIAYTPPRTGGESSHPPLNIAKHSKT